MKYKLRPRQEKAVEDIEKYISNKQVNHGLFVFPTSFGKSILISEIASRHSDKYFINVASSKELLNQNFEKFLSYNLEAVLCSSSLGNIETGKITFATIGTLIKQYEFFSDKNVVIIDDEAQDGSAVGSQLDKFIKKLKNYKLIGVSATPFRLSQSMDGSSLKIMSTDKNCIYKSIETVCQISDIVSDGHWSDLVYDVRDMTQDKLELNSSKTDFTDDSMKFYQEDNNLINQIVSEALKLRKQGRKSLLISVPFIVDALELEEKLGNCKAIYSGMNAKERDSIVKDFKNLELHTIVQCKILSVGFDHPLLDSIIMAKPSNSLSFYYQLIGRGVRIHENKKDCLILDMSGNFKRFGDIRNIKIENVENYGWAVLNNDKLITDVLLDSKETITRRDLEIGKKPKKTENFKFSKECDGLAKMSVGQNKGIALQRLYHTKRFYLKWLIEKDFKFKPEDEEFERQLKEIYKC